ncbi:hypothetical protein EYS42_09130 [Aquabacterium lacunae]|uniref:Pectinacetylesterase n=1 Tax=Aquabacterium lacunae TaxID=2528630 RepID=A0A4Q9H4Y2_9BURK|nr:pectin acetylesterase-family hydrolase [Aquabacterium lacunae]TBO31389.1 hypothetical protein EYS42_09130 [Aquabacterium lacunae]
MPAKPTIVRSSLGAIALACVATAAQAAQPWTPDTTGNVGPAPTSFNKWEMIEFPASTGASCGNGSPYRIFINRTTTAADKAKTVVMFEGGGACWEQNACQQKDGVLGATNYNGIKENYMTGGGLALYGWVTPFTSRNHPLQKVQTQSWNIIYAPYCTGDVHSGNKSNVYGDADPKTAITYRHKGFMNGQAIANWMGKHLPKQDKLLVTGFSAGGAGATSMYGLIRLAVQPKQSAMLADSGPIFQVNRSDSPEVSPSIHLHNTIRDKWGIEGEEGLANRMLATFPTAGTIENLGSLTTGLARVFPQDRFGYATFQADAIYSSFSYTKFYPEIAAAPAGSKRDALLLAKWQPEVKKWVTAMQPEPNIGYYVPYGRDFLKSHTLTTATFSGTAIKEAGIKDIGAFTDNLLDPSKPIMRVVEQNRTVQNSQGIGFFSSFFNTFYALIGL